VEKGCRGLERPIAIIWFERCYLGAFAIKTLFLILNWYRVNSAVAQIGTTIALLLWFGVVHRHSTVSRWLVVAFSIWGVISFALAAASGGYGILPNCLLLVATILNAIAAFQLIDSRAEGWFAKAAS
jgi:hypothetical protein